MSVNFSQVVQLIKAKWSCVDYCRNVLNLPIYREGDRCLSPLHPARANREDAFWVFNDHWIDWEEGGKGGDVIELCALTRHNGNRGEAFRELGAEFYSGYDSQAWQIYSESLTKTIERWHDILISNPLITDINGNSFRILDYLYSRRINDETILRLKLGFCNEPKSAMYFRLVVPYFQNGQPVYYAGRDMSGKWKIDKSCGKYKKKFTGGSLFSRNIPWGLDSLTPLPDAEAITDNGINKNDILVIGEGMFDIMSFWQEHWHVLSSIGGYFSKKNMPMIADIARKFQRVFICFDSDAPGQQFQLDMAKFLFSNRIPFICGHLPAMFEGQNIKDVSDYYAAGGDLSQIVAKATDGITDLARAFPAGSEQDFKKFILSVGRFADKADLSIIAQKASAPDPIKTAMLDENTRALLAQQSGHLDASFVKACIDEAKKAPQESQIVDEIAKAHTLLYMKNDSFYEYQRGIWVERPEQVIQYYAKQALGDFAIYGRMRSAARHLMAVKFCDEEFNSQRIVNFPNGVLDLDTFELKPHSESYMSSIQQSFLYDPDATCPTWLRFIDTVMEHDPLKMQFLGEMPAYALFPDCSLETGFFLIGDGANGKSVYLNTLRALFGDRYCSSVEPSRMAHEFDPLALRHSLLNIATESRLDLHSAEAAIKKIISGETIRAAHKGVDAIEFRPRAKFFCAVNNFINSKDITYGFMRRFIFVPFNVTFTTETADNMLSVKLREELPGIFNWLLTHYKRLRETRNFTTFPEHEAILAEFMSIANPLAGFIDMELAGWNGTTITTTDLFNDYYKPWCQKVNCMPTNIFNFSRQLKILLHQKMPGVSFKRNSTGSQTVITFPERPVTPPPAMKARQSAMKHKPSADIIDWEAM